MDIGIVSVRYAKALLRFATENQEDEAVYTEMENLADAYHQVDMLQTTLLNPALPNEQKKQLLAAACTGKAPLSLSTRRFIELVIAKKRADLMMFIAHAYITLYRKAKNIIKGRLTLPVPVSEKTSKRLQEMMESKSQNHVEFEVRIDKDIQGGFILDYDTFRLDASLRTQLKDLYLALQK